MKLCVIGFDSYSALHCFWPPQSCQFEKTWTSNFAGGTKWQGSLLFLILGFQYLIFQEVQVGFACEVFQGFESHRLNFLQTLLSLALRRDPSEHCPSLSPEFNPLKLETYIKNNSKLYDNFCVYLVLKQKYIVVYFHICMISCMI